MNEVECPICRTILNEKFSFRSETSVLCDDCSRIPRLQRQYDVLVVYALEFPTGFLIYAIGLPVVYIVAGFFWNDWSPYGMFMYSLPWIFYIMFIMSFLKNLIDRKAFKKELIEKLTVIKFAGR